MPSLLRQLRLPCWIAGLLLLGAVTACRPAAPEPPSDVLRMLSFFPSDVQQVAQIDLRQLQADGVLTLPGEDEEFRLFDQPLGSSAAGSEAEGLLSFLQEAGINLSDDVHTVMLTSPMAGLSLRLDGPFAVVHLTMDRERVMDALKARDGTRSEELSTDDIPVFIFNGGEGRSESNVALLDDEHLLFGLSTDVEQVLSADEGFVPSPADRALLGHVATGRSAWSVWFGLPTQEDLGARPTATSVSADDQRSDQNELAESFNELRELASVVEQMGMGLKMTEDHMRAQVTLAAGDAAADVRRVLRGVRSAAQSRDDLSADQRALLEEMSITDEGRFVLLTFDGSTNALREFVEGL